MNCLVLLALVGVDARRPASWIAAALGAVAGWFGGAAGGGAWTPGVAIAISSLAVVAAVGDLPVQACGPAAGGSPARLAGTWAAERSAWPLVGAVLAVGWSTWFGAHPDWAEPHRFSLALGSLVAALLTLLAVAFVRLSGRDAADAATLGLALAAAAAAAALSARSAGFGMRSALGTAGVTWCLVALVAGAWWRSTAVGARPAEPAQPGRQDGRETPAIDPLPAAGPVQQALEKIAMITALAAMAGWLAFDADQPDQLAAAAGAWAALSAAWYVCLAVPRTVLGDGVCGTAAWDRLVRSAARRPRGEWRGMRLPAGLPERGVRFALAAALPPAAILGWPPLVGGLLSLSRPAWAWPPLAITLALALAAATLAMLVAAGRISGLSRETSFAVVLGLIVAAVGGGAVAAPPLPSRQRAAAPIPPRLPSLAGEASRATPVFPVFLAFEWQAWAGWGAGRPGRGFHVEENAAPCEASALTASLAGW
jgi:hypothetical protein